MNDETALVQLHKMGKKNITHKVMEENGDQKLMRSGEITPNHLASLTFLNDYEKKSNGRNALHSIKDDVTLTMPITRNAVGMAQQHQQEQDQQHKCCWCIFRHTNRDAVLAHVKIHYQIYPIVTAFYPIYQIYPIVFLFIYVLLLCFV